jgi:hypothetical protein
MHQVEPIGRRTLPVSITAFRGWGLQRSGGLNTARPGFIEGLPWWVGVGRGLTPHAPCAQRLFPGRGCGCGSGGLTVFGPPEILTPHPHLYKTINYTHLQFSILLFFYHNIIMSIRFISYILLIGYYL